MTQTQKAGLLDSRPAELVEQFHGLLMGNLMIDLLLGVVERPKPQEIALRTRHAMDAFRQLHSCADNASV